jgi:hypothetical protein
MLLSYAHVNDRTMELVRATQGSVRWMLDSGAFTAHTQNRPIDVQDYIAFCLDTKPLWWRQVALDVVGDTQRSDDNLQAMLDAGLKPMPVLTVDANVAEAQRLAQVSGALCVAGGVTHPMEHYAPRLAQIRKAVGPDVWLHGLGFGRGMQVASTRVDSVDASSWMAAQRWGRFCWFQGTKGVRSVAWSEVVGKRWADLPTGIRRALVAMGLNRALLGDRDTMTRGAVSVLGLQCALASLQYTAALQQRGVRFIFPIPIAPQLSMALLIAARHGTPQGLRWADCAADVAIYPEILRDPALLTPYAQAAAENAERVWGIK